MTDTWVSVKDKMPENGSIVMTKIHDDEGERMEQLLKRLHNMWFHINGDMYIYYTPTHWKIPNQ